MFSNHTNKHKRFDEFDVKCKKINIQISSELEHAPPALDDTFDTPQEEENISKIQGDYTSIFEKSL